MLKSTYQHPIKFEVGKKYNITHYFNNVKGKYEASEIISCKYLGNRDGWDKFLDPDLDVISLHNNACCDESSDYYSSWHKWEIGEFINIEYTVELKGSVLMVTVKHPTSGVEWSTSIGYESELVRFIKSCAKDIA